MYALRVGMGSMKERAMVGLRSLGTSHTKGYASRVRSMLGEQSGLAPSKKGNSRHSRHTERLLVFILTFKENSKNAASSGELGALL